MDNKKLAATLRALATKERKHYEDGIKRHAEGEYIGTCKGMWIAYEDAAKRILKEDKDECNR